MPRSTTRITIFTWRHRSHRRNHRTRTPTPTLNRRNLQSRTTLPPHSNRTDLTTPTPNTKLRSYSIDVRSRPSRMRVNTSIKFVGDRLTTMFSMILGNLTPVSKAAPSRLRSSGSDSHARKHARPNERRERRRRASKQQQQQLLSLAQPFIHHRMVPLYQRRSASRTRI